MKKEMDDELKKAIEIVDAEIEKHKKNLEADGDIETLDKIRDQLNKMLYYMNPDKYMPSYNYILRDDLWDYMNIADPLLKVFHHYVTI